MRTAEKLKLLEAEVFSLRKILRRLEKLVEERRQNYIEDEDIVDPLIFSLSEEIEEASSIFSRYDLQLGKKVRKGPSISSRN
jgi:hypothetical protein